MSIGRNCRPGGAAAALLLAVVAVAASDNPTARGKSEPPPAPAASEPLDRPEAEAIESETRSILSDPRYAPRKSCLQWLLEKLENWEIRLGEGAGMLGPVLFWAIVVVCVATLLAILGHLVWTIAVYFRGTRVSGGAGGVRGAGPGLIPPDASYEDLEELRLRLAREGRFREAVGVMMVALLRWLELRGALEFHRSKTNGEYVREFPPRPGARDEFVRFVNRCDGVIYGASPCDREEYGGLEAACERVRGHVRRNP